MEDKIDTIRFNEVNTDLDLELIMAWRSNPLIFNSFRLQNKPLIWEEHLLFWKNKKNRLDYLIIFEGRKIGCVALVGTHEPVPEISIFVGEVSLWGKGIAKNVLNSFIEFLSSIGFRELKARINSINQPSLRLFLRQGFIVVETEKILDQLWLVLERRV